MPLCVLGQVFGSVYAIPRLAYSKRLTLTRDQLMSRFFHPTFLTLTICLMMGGIASANTYYIASNGSDSNNGTSKTTPWLHAPGMKICSNACASANPKPGDQFIFRGGDTWTSSSFTWAWDWSGSSGNPITLGVDQTWFSGSSWTRPIFSGGGTFPGNSAAFLLNISSATYVTVADFEFTGVYWSGSSAASGILGYIYLGLGSNPSNILIHDNYFHGWSHAAGVVEDNNTTAIFCNSTHYDLTTQVYSNAIDGSDTTEDSFQGIYGYGCGAIYQNYIAYVVSGVNGGFAAMHDNTFFHAGLNDYSGGGSHNNEFISNTDAPNGSVVYNNLFMSAGTATTAGGVGIWLAPLHGTTSYAFNNVIVDQMPIPNSTICSYNLNGQSAGGNCVYFNNTVECGPDAGADGPPSWNCLRMDGQSGNGFPGGGQVINNHWVSSYTSSGGVSINVDSGCNCMPAQNPNPQISQTEAVAGAQGYAFSQNFAFSPTASSNVTVGAGVNEGALCTTISGVNAAAGTACRSDTTYGVAYDTSTHTVGGLARTPVARPSSGALDVGAYQFANGQPNPPTGLSAVVN
jgi:hypothetical protein